MNRQRGFVASLLMYAILAAGVLAAIWGVVAYLEQQGYAKAEAKWKPAFEEVSGKYERFSASVAATAKAEQERQAAEAARWRTLLAERKTGYEATIARLSNDNTLLDRSMQHYRDVAARAYRGSSGVQTVPGSASASGPGSTDALAACHATVGGLSKDCAVTTAMFVDCRDTWKGISRK